ncbi:hypothetical protein SMACR_02018 [Sordaria macrospora]|uniref:Rhodopsin domain-containing protein n=1 Tax=Sordaria macrospora TaxID=5147 RepID=A0A8S8ZZZ2_SORMA|nr:hypothetical protein SMACR_02018 [Sordaria macrospora]KAH7631953.1 hypothetical protein B0T09DRAFT_336638 [Sordaria sp. MPI-SDFR-AT-0083]WPJ63254.1 hypothetical protein SMAC4_02018 [Sordaria macrospora]
MESEDRGSEILAITWTLTGLAALFVIVRIVWKFRSNKTKLWWDDHVCSLSWFVLKTSTFIITIATSKGLGKHVQAIPEENLPAIGLIGNFIGTLSILASVWSKTSFALTLLHLLSGRWTKDLLWLGIATIHVFLIVNALFMWIRCSPAAKTWDVYMKGTCWDNQVYPQYAMFAAGYSAAVDFILVLLPLALFYQLQMLHWKERLGISLAIIVAFLSGAGAVKKATVISGLTSSDFTFTTAPLIYYSTAESALTIIAACILSLSTLSRVVQPQSSTVNKSLAENQSQTSESIPLGAASAASAASGQSSAPPSSSSGRENNNGIRVVEGRESEGGRERNRPWYKLPPDTSTWPGVLM